MATQLSNALAAFVCAAETGSFAAAGKMLGVSAPAVGQSVKRLEDAYGVVLIRRTTRKMNLTPEGILLYERAKEPLRALDELDGIFRETRSTMSGRIRLTSPRGLGCRLVLPLVAEFRVDYPDVVFELDFTYQQRDFIDDGVDLAFRVLSPEDSSMIARRLTCNEHWTLASPTYLEMHGEPSHPDDLSGHRTIVCQKRFSDPMIAWQFDVAGNVRTFPQEPDLILNDPDAICEAAAMGMGIIQMRDDYARPLVERGELTPILKDFTAPANALYLCYPYKEHLPLRVRTFIDFVVDRVKADETGCAPHEGFHAARK